MHTHDNLFGPPDPTHHADEGRPSIGAIRTPGRSPLTLEFAQQLVTPHAFVEALERSVTPESAGSAWYVPVCLIQGGP